MCSSPPPQWRSSFAGGNEVSGIVGLTNIGNTCFMNAGLQCLSHLGPLAQYFLSGGYLQDLPREDGEKEQGVLAEAFADLQRNLWRGEDGIFKPHRLHGLVRNRFELGIPHDAQEFVELMIDTLNWDLKRPMKTPPPLSQAERRAFIKKHHDEEEYAAALAWQTYLEHERKSFIVDLFAGQQRSTVTCAKCGKTTRTFEPFYTLAVELRPGTETIEDALRDYCEEETLEGKDEYSWKCGKCGARGKGRKKLDIWKLPPVLVVQLKRFKFDPRRGASKIESLIKAPKGQVDLTDLCSSVQKQGARYTLASVINHHGDFSGGHYTCNCRVGSDGSWYKFDDARVTKIGEGRPAVTNEAYIFFYVRVDANTCMSMEAPRLPRAPPSRQTLSAPEEWPHMISTEIVSTTEQLRDDISTVRRRSGMSVDAKEDPEMTAVSLILDDGEEQKETRKEDDHRSMDTRLALEMQSEERKKARERQRKEDEKVARRLQEREFAEQAPVNQAGPKQHRQQSEEKRAELPQQGSGCELKGVASHVGGILHGAMNDGRLEKALVGVDGWRSTQKVVHMTVYCPPLVLQGWLRKRGPCAMYGWKPMWCVLRLGTLECFMADDCKEKKVEIELPASARAVAFTAPEAPSDAIKHRNEIQHGFVLDRHPDGDASRRLFYFDPGSQEGLRRWTRALEEAAGGEDPYEKLAR